MTVLTAEQKAVFLDWIEEQLRENRLESNPNPLLEISMECVREILLKDPTFPFHPKDDHAVACPQDHR